VVNKADRDGADRAVRDLYGMLELRSGESKEIEIVKTTATTGQGLDDLVAALARHQTRMQSSEAGKQRRRRRAEAQLRDLLGERLFARIDELLRPRGGLQAVAEQVAESRVDPYSAADTLVAQLLR
jgi:LAO/AO transport system kinase